MYRIRQDYSFLLRSSGRLLDPQHFKVVIERKIWTIAVFFPPLHHNNRFKMILDENDVFHFFKIKKITGSVTLT